LRRAGRFDDDSFGDVFLVIDGWMTLRNEYEDLEQSIADLAQRGLGYGIHLVVTAARGMEVRGAMRDMFGTRLELRLGDPSDSAVNRRAAMTVPEQTPGRGLTPDGLHFLAGLPRVDSQQEAVTLVDGVADLVRRVRESAEGPPAPRVRLLPGHLPYEALDGAGVESAARALPVGIAESDLRPVFLDFDAEPHLLLFGDTECGKSTFLRALAHRITQQLTPAQARVILVDYRRSLLGCVSGDHLIGYGTAAPVTADLIGQVTTVLRRRLPGPDVTPEQLRDRSWWRGPDAFVLVDDYDLVASGGTNPLAGLLEFLAQGRDIGLRLIVTRRVGGAGRALFDPLLARLKELAVPGVLMSGPREEGAIFGNLKPQPLPPGRGWLVTRRASARLVQFTEAPLTDTAEAAPTTQRGLT
jgi:S-DNA-T family DNA segregation ATPase FtsK/SpoIIIE